MGEWVKANGGPLAFVIVGLGIVGFTNKWVGFGLIAIGLGGWLGQAGWRWMQRGTPRATVLSDADLLEPPKSTMTNPVETAQPEHRDALRKALSAIAVQVQRNRPDPTEGLMARAVEAHYPELAEGLAKWSTIANYRLIAPQRLQERFEAEPDALNLPPEFNRTALATGFRASRQLGLFRASWASS